MTRMLCFGGVLFAYRSTWTQGVSTLHFRFILHFKTKTMDTQIRPTQKASWTAQLLNNGRNRRTLQEIATNNGQKMMTDFVNCNRMTKREVIKM